MVSTRKKKVSKKEAPNLPNFRLNVRIKIYISKNKFFTFKLPSMKNRLFMALLKNLTILLSYKVSNSILSSLGDQRIEF